DLGYRGQVCFGGEGLVFEGEVPLQGVNSRHQTVSLASPAKGGEAVDILVEAAANPYHPWGGLEWPMMLPDYDGDLLYTLAQFDLAVLDRDLYECCTDWGVLLELADELGPGDRRSAEIVATLDSVARGVDLEDPRGSVAPKRDSWAHLLDSPTPKRAHQVTAVGHAHIDSAWLWPLRETRRKCARTFSSALRLMDDEPDFVFVCSQAQQHAWMEEDYPALFEAMKEKVAAGQLEPVGSMWVEPDTNLPSGESLVRQLVHGKRFFLDRYGVETVDCWLPDAFGYSGNLPQILQSAGVRYFLTQKLSWNETNAFPHHTFLWEGIDGSRVLAHCPPTDTYNGDFHVPQLLGGERSFAQHGVSRHSLYPYGYGDGGGGPTKAMLDRYRRLRDLDPLPRIELGTGRGFFEAVQAEASRAEEVSGRANEGTVTTAHGPGPGGLPVWVGELYLERHRGVQTTQARSKLGNRRCENLLREAELWTAAAFDGEEADEAAALLERAWQTVLLHQFHDILPGSSIHWVHDDSRRAYADVEDLLGGLIARSIARLAGRPSRFADSAPADSTPTGEALAPEVATGDELGTVVLFNAATDDRRGIVELDLDDLGLSGEPTTAVSQHGEELAVQQTSGSRLILCAAAPGSGWSSYKLKRTRRADQGEPAARALDVRTLTNGLVTLAMDENGFVTSLFDHMHEREAIARGQRANAFQLHRDLPNDADAWDVDPGTFDRAEEISALNEEEIVEEGPIRASIRHVRRFGDSVITQEIRLAAQSRRVEFITELEWSERHRFLKVAFPLQVRASHATFEVQFGHVERPTHANTSW
ncbi:MAG: alpha-mannosidase, partial [Acidimicrobiales bacterium]